MVFDPKDNQRISGVECLTGPQRSRFSVHAKRDVILCAGGIVVVDEKDLRVVGIKGLRVWGALVLPTLPTVNPMLAILMIAERTADILEQNLWTDHTDKLVHRVERGSSFWEQRKKCLTWGRVWSFTALDRRPSCS